MAKRAAAATRWEHLMPDPALVACLDKADGPQARRNLLGGAISASTKNNWSNRFADACARMVADQLVTHPAVRKQNLSVLPSTGSAEPPTFVAGGKRKKVDVVASSTVAGLQIGFSLKAGNFRDRANRNFDKNLTGRSYELAQEMRVLHGYQPSAFMVCLYYFPIAATVDKARRSSFAHAVEFLRERTGRDDHMAEAQMGLFDMAMIGLYVPGDHESYAHPGEPGGRLQYDDPFPRGVVRYFDVDEDPPRRGRPVLSSTHDLPSAIDLTVQRWLGGSAPITWAAPEDDAP